MGEKASFLKKGQELVYTSAEDIRASLNHVGDVRVIKAGLMYERSWQNRVTVIRMLESRIRRMEKEGSTHEKA